MKAIKQVLQKDKEKYRVPKRVQDLIPIKRIWNDGIFLVGTRYAKSFKFTDINYMVASQEAQRKMFLDYAALSNSLDCSATTKIIVNNQHLNRKNFADTVLMKNIFAVNAIFSTTLKRGNPPPNWPTACLAFWMS